ncbi:hypothetical protein N7447_008298 [Penicillium robsamsonii]|uniref:uncharacterized protein n=1 Tax=Penicillium robsamsonii TaxID=1792511 RepID=UPI002549AC1A|nr:uncharacterized protein N7447_008298 [Penicillium robsamsonii]KAJ5816065.1 hypothetical protein N7447_008298 [Penicillium robsamsonii]
MPEKSLDLQHLLDMDKGLVETDGIQNKLRNLKETVHGQEERLRKSERQKDIVHEKITSLQEQLSMRDFIQQHSGLKERLAMHERLLEIADQQINTQQELIKHLFDAQISTSRQLAHIKQKLPQQPEQCVQQPQVEELEGQQSNPGGVNKSTDASDYVLVSEDEVTTI